MERLRLDMLRPILYGVVWPRCMAQMTRKLLKTGRGVKDVVVSTMNPVQRMAAYFDEDYTFVCKTCV